MHHALKIKETLRMIAAELRPADQISMGLSCKTFYEPAMDEIWHTIPTLAVLLFCLPERCVVGNLCHGPDPGWVRIKGRPTASEWESFRRYSRRVRVVKSMVRDIPNRSCWRLGLQTRIDGVLFTNLRQCDIRGPFGTRELCLFVQPSLRVLRCQVDPQHMETWRMDSIISGNTPNLEVFDISRLDCQCVSKADFCVFDDPQAGAVLSTAILRYPRLTSMHFSAPFSNECLQHLSRLPRLTRLGIHLNDNNSTPLAALDDDNVFFRSVQTLRIESQNATQLICWLKPLRLPYLTTLSIRISTLPSIPAVEELFQTISRFEDLTSLRILVDDDDDADISEYPISKATLRTLTSNLPLIEEFCIRGLPFNPSRIHIVICGVAWPDLRTLDVHRTCHLDPLDSGVTLHDLLVLVELCPNIEHVSLPWSQVIPDPPWETYGDSDLERDIAAYAPSLPSEIRPPNINLKTLRISDPFGPLESLVVAKFLGKNFPSVRLTCSCPKIPGQACQETVLMMIMANQRRL